MRITKITIIRSTKPEPDDINMELQWFGASLGLFGVRDKDKSCFRVFITLLKSLKEQNNMTSDEIALKTKLTRGTVVHHLNNLMGAGIVIAERNTYSLRMDNLKEVVKHMRRDADEAWERIMDVATNIDEKLGLK